MVRGYHVIFTAYGFWLPNDPRGSGSVCVRVEELRQFGPATKVTTRRSVARKPHDVRRRLAAKAELTYPPVTFSGIQARAIGRGFEEYVTQSGVTVWACSILPAHVHLVLARYRYNAETMVTQFKAAATRQLLAEGLHPLAAYREEGGPLPHCWGKGRRKVFLNDDADILRSIRYVEENPLREGKPAQRWRFVTPFRASA